jgi:hypothetical protein
MIEPKYKYILGKRDKNTKSKASIFIVQKVPKERYISSCYHVGDNIYEIEFNKKRTRIDITTNWQKKVDDFINNKAT